MKNTKSIKDREDYREFNNKCISENKCPLLTYVEMRKKEKGIK